MTLLDMYMLLGTLWLFAVVVYSGCVKMLPRQWHNRLGLGLHSDNTPHEVDSLAMRGSILILLVGHMLALLHCMRMRSREVCRTKHNTPEAPKKNLKVGKQHQLRGVAEGSGAPTEVFVTAH